MNAEIPIKSEKEEQNNTVCLDFDGVIHQMEEWKGDAVIDGPPIYRAVESIKSLRADGFTVKVNSTRCRCEEGRVAIKEWLEKLGIEVDEICEHKPPALCYLDDRSITFRGNWGIALLQIKSFKPYTADWSKP